MGIVGTVDSAYKALRAAAAEIEGRAMLAAGQFGLGSGTPVGFGTVGPSGGVRHFASCKGAAGNASVQRGRRGEFVACFTNEGSRAKTGRT